MAVSRDFKYVYSAGERLEFYFDRQNDPRELQNLAVSHPAHPGVSAARENLLTYLWQCGMREAVSTSGQALSWRAWPPRDESELADPDARLILQDYSPR